MGKKKNTDFQKIKFKVGKRLPRGTNVTDTSFKAKKIVIRNQLREGGDSLGSFTNKKPTVKEYLNRLLNYNPGTRVECVIGLKDHLVQKPEAILPNLAGIIEKACELMVDREIRVREAVLSLLNIVFKHVSPNHITPFFSIVTSYLSCAMTHIVSDIRKSSLEFVDLLLEKYPEQTVTVGSQVLFNFLEQISVEKDSGLGGVPVRTLAITPSSSLSTQTWRVGVLRRMEKFLTAAIEYWKSRDNKENDSKVKEVRWDGNSPLYCPIYNTGPFQPMLLPLFTLNSTDPFALEVNTLRDSKVVKNFISVLIPLLKETWIEAQPSHSSKKGNISKNLGETMYSILKVAYLLGDWAEILDKDTKGSENLAFFQETFTRDFLTQFMSNFPYSFLGTPMSKLSSEDKKSTLTSLELNLTLCKLYSVTVSELNKIRGLSGHCFDKVIDYLINIFEREEVRGTKNISIALKTVKRMIDYNMNEDFCGKLHNALYSLCKNWKANRKERQPIFDYFVDLCLIPKYRPFLNSAPVKEFLGNFPEELINESNNKEYLTILAQYARRIAPKKYEPFLSSLQKNDIAIIKLLGQVRCINEEQETLERYLIEIILGIPKLNMSAFRELSEILRTEFIADRNRNYLLQVLSFRCYQSGNKMHFDPGHFLSLLLCLQFGVSLSEGPALQKKYQSHPDFNYFRNNTPEIFRFAIVPSETNSWKHHMLLTKDICQLLMQFPDITDVAKGTEIYLSKLLNTCQFLPIHCVAGILNLAAALNFATSGLTSELNRTLVELALSGLVTNSLTANLNDKLKPRYLCEEYVVIMFGFIMNSKDCTSLMCQILLRQISSTEALSEGETDCIGWVVVEIIKNSDLKREQAIIIAKILQKLRAFNSVDGKRWYRQVCYDLKEHSQKSAKY